MSANLLSINQSKTEFLLVILPAQLSIISAPSLLMPSNVSISPAQSVFCIKYYLLLTKNLTAKANKKANANKNETDSRHSST